MAGTKRGKIECYINTGNRNTHAQVFFKNLYDFFASHPQYTIISLQYGAGGPGILASGNGTGYYDQTGSLGYNAFFVARQNATSNRPFDVYHLFQWTGANSGATTPPTAAAQLLGALSSSAPALIQSVQTYNGSVNTEIGYACAIGIGGTGGSALSPNNGNPWKGSMNVDGRDYKGTGVGTTAVWGAPSGGSGIITFPRCNNGINGTFASLSQNMMLIFQNGNTDTWQTRQNIIADDDSFVILTDVSDVGAYSLTYAGIYRQRPDIPSGSIPYPYCVICTCNSNLPFSYTSVYGDTAGNSTQQGGIVTPLSGTSVNLLLDHYSTNFMVDGNFWPDRQMSQSSAIFNEFHINVNSYELATQNSPQTYINNGNFCAQLGELDFIHEVYNIATNTVRSDYSRIFVGSATLASTHYSIPWDSSTNTVPRTGTTRQGVTFTSNN